MAYETTTYGDIPVSYTGNRGPLFKLILQTLFLTTITLGIYRFWMKARVRRYYWSAVQPGGHGFEYLGTGIEKFIGFLIAVVFLAIYLGIFQLLLTFAGIVFMSESAINFSFIAAIPLIFYARYRARRYILARTRWRGIRFGAEKAAVGYALRAMGYTLLSIVTLGIMFPYQVFQLEKFATDRTWFGDMRLTQNGKWTNLMKPWLISLGMIVVAFVVLAGVFSVIATMSAGVGVRGGMVFLIVGAVVVFYLLIGLSFVFFGVQSFRILTNNKTAGDSVRLSSQARAGRVIRIYLIGGIGVVGTALLMFLALGLIMGLVFGGGLEIEGSLQGIGGDLAAGNLGSAIYTFVGYILVILVVSGLAHLMIVQPVLRHYATTVTVSDPHGELERVQQRVHDSSVEAEGFADALDVGAAI